MSCSNCPYCLHRYVLVVHDDFKTATVYFRRTGDDMDVANLRRAFANERNCHFAELANCSSAEILAILSDWQRLSALFGHESGIFRNNIQTMLLVKLTSFTIKLKEPSDNSKIKFIWCVWQEAGILL